MYVEETISAIATSTGIGGIGIVRLSGPESLAIAQKITGRERFTPRYAHYAQFLDREGAPIDEGVVIYYAAPNSFTGEDVIELQGHGGLVVLNRVLKETLTLGARLARRGEFSERAFLNGKLDLVQAEAIHDLIVSQSEAQAKAAINSLTGQFSERIEQLLTTLIELRVYIEASIDFSEEDIDFISDGNVLTRLEELNCQVEKLLNNADQGRLLTDGVEVVIAGRPNAGKSSLLNALSGEESAIVTDIEGTTRDLLREQISINGLPLHIIDTAGLRETDDAVESEGIKRARRAMEEADLILWLHDDTQEERDLDEHLLKIETPILYLHNKIDLSGRSAGDHEEFIAFSAKSGEGLDEVKRAILKHVGFDAIEGQFSARERHLEALRRVLQHFFAALSLIKVAESIELVAEELRIAQDHLGEITGEFTHDELLGEIFSSFCVGK